MCTISRFGCSRSPECPVRSTALPRPVDGCLERKSTGSISLERKGDKNPWTSRMNGRAGIGHSSCVSARRPGMGVVVGPYGESATGRAESRESSEYVPGVNPGVVQGARSSLGVMRTRLVGRLRRRITSACSCGGELKAGRARRCGASIQPARRERTRTLPGAPPPLPKSPPDPPGHARNTAPGRHGSDGPRQRTKTTHSPLIRAITPRKMSITVSFL